MLTQPRTRTVHRTKTYTLLLQNKIRQDKYCAISVTPGSRNDRISPPEKSAPSFLPVTELKREKKKSLPTRKINFKFHKSRGNVGFENGCGRVESSLLGSLLFTLPRNCFEKRNDGGALISARMALY